MMPEGRKFYSEKFQVVAYTQQNWLFGRNFEKFCASEGVKAKVLTTCLSEMSGGDRLPYDIKPTVRCLYQKKLMSVACLSPIDIVFAGYVLEELPWKGSARSFEQRESSGS